MGKLFKVCILPVFVLCWGLFPGNEQAVAQQQGCVTAECHSRFQGGEAIHPEGAECVSCHLNIQEDHAKGDAKSKLKHEVCLECHKDMLSQPHMHSPVTKGECSLCHNPHGDRKNKYLPESYSMADYLPYSEKEYRFCFSCHKRELLMFPDTSFSTGFRDGLRNLHFLHVKNKKRGKNCKLCHAMHGGNLEKLMADTALFGTWPMPINFQKNEFGGQCAPGCHVLRRYNRKNLSAEGQGQEGSK